MARRRRQMMTHEALERAAYHYLGRFASTQANLRRVLEAKLRRRNPDFAPATDEQVGWLQAVVDKCVALGLVDDRAYAQAAVQSLNAQGRSVKAIRARLTAKGVPADELDAALGGLTATDSDTDPDLAAAAAYARRRRFGPYRRDGEAGDEHDRRRRELAAFARAGFAYGLARQILEAADPTAVDAMLEAGGHDRSWIVEQEDQA